MSRRSSDLLVTAISEWLAGHSNDERLEAEVTRVGTGGLADEQREAVEELLTELRCGAANPAELNMVARETLQTLVSGA